MYSIVDQYHMDKGDSYKYAKYKAKYLNTVSPQIGQLDQLGQIGGDSGNHQDIMTALFAHLIQIKMLHFQSKKYGGHKALDKYFDGFMEKMDQFMEVLQGDKGRITVPDGQMPITVPIANDENISAMLDTFRKSVLIKLVDDKYIDNSGLISIRDEMVADIDQLKYLLTFE